MELFQKKSYPLILGKELVSRYYAQPQKDLCHQVSLPSHFRELKKADQRISLGYSASKAHYRGISNSDVLAAASSGNVTFVVAVGLAYKAPRLNRRFPFQ
jgi:hypothetical protein